MSAQPRTPTAMTSSDACNATTPSTSMKRTPFIPNAPRRQRPSIELSLLAVLALALTLCACAAPSAHGAVVGKRQFFTNCLGWGPSCSVHRWTRHPSSSTSSSSSSRGSITRTDSTPSGGDRSASSRSPNSQSRKPFQTGASKAWARNRAHTLFTSSGWGAGTIMGKRNDVITNGIDAIREKDSLMRLVRRGLAALRNSRLGASAI